MKKLLNYYLNNVSRETNKKEWYKYEWYNSYNNISITINSINIYIFVFFGGNKMRDIEENILKSLEEDIKILKRVNFKTDEIIDHIRNFRDFSNDNTEEYKKEIDKLMEELK